MCLGIVTSLTGEVRKKVEICPGLTEFTLKYLFLKVKWDRHILPLSKQKGLLLLLTLLNSWVLSSFYHHMNWNISKKQQIVCLKWFFRKVYSTGSDKVENVFFSLSSVPTSPPSYLSVSLSLPSLKTSASLTVSEGD